MREPGRNDMIDIVFCPFPRSSMRWWVDGTVEVKAVSRKGN